MSVLRKGAPIKSISKKRTHTATATRRSAPKRIRSKAVAMLGPTSRVSDGEKVTWAFAHKASISQRDVETLHRAYMQDGSQIFIALLASQV